MTSSFEKFKINEEMFFLFLILRYYQIYVNSCSSDFTNDMKRLSRCFKTNSHL